MAKYKVKRKCYYTGRLYFEGQVVEFASRPDTELFASVDGREEASFVPDPPDPAGKSISPAEATAMKKTARPQKADRG